MIDEQYQGKGVRKRSLALILEKLQKDYNKNEIHLSVHDNNVFAIKLYETLGFIFTNQIDPMGELVMVYRSS